MSASILLYTLLVGVVLAGAAGSLDRALRLSRLPSRWVWAAALFALLVLAGAAVLRALVPAAGDILSIVPTAPTAAAATETPSREIGVVLNGALQSAANRVAALLGEGAARGLGVAWLAGSLLLFGCLVAVHLRLSRAARSWPRRRVHDVPVAVSTHVGPLVRGLWRPEIVVPEWFADADVAAQRSMLAHEQEHVRARDPWLLAGAALALVLLPWHPMTWWLAARLRLAIELDCDGRVLRRGVDRNAYGEALLTVAGRRGNGWVAAPALTLSASQLERRLIAMTQRKTRLARAQSAGLVVLSGALALAACSADVPTAAEIEQLDVQEVEARAKDLQFKVEAVPIYMVDGKVVTEEEAKTLRGEQIGSIEVRKSHGAEPSTIALRTKRAAALEPAGEIRVRHGEASEPLTVAGYARDKVELRKLPSGTDSAGVTRYRVHTMDPELRPKVVEGSLMHSEGLVIVDGKVATMAVMRALAPNSIESITVLKGEEARKLYPDARAMAGVIVVTTRQ